MINTTRNLAVVENRLLVGCFFVECPSQKISSNVERRNLESDAVS